MSESKKHVTFNNLAAVFEFNKDTPPIVVNRIGSNSRAIRYPKSRAIKKAAVAHPLMSYPQMFLPLMNQYQYQYFLALRAQQALKTQQALQAHQSLQYQKTGGHMYMLPMTFNSRSQLNQAPINPFTQSYKCCNSYNNKNINKLAQKTGYHTNPLIQDILGDGSENEHQKCDDRASLINDEEHADESLTLNDEDLKYFNDIPGDAKEVYDEIATPGKQETHPIITSPLSPMVNKNTTSSYLLSSKLAQPSGEPLHSGGKRSQITHSASVPRSFYSKIPATHDANPSRYQDLYEYKFNNVNEPLRKKRRAC